jgi:hypothetical protein
MDEILATALSRAVHERLDTLASRADRQWLSSSASVAIIRLAATLRDMLAQHGPDDHGRCRKCSGLFRHRAHPCSVWTVAHQHLVTATSERIQTGQGRHALRSGVAKWVAPDHPRRSCETRQSEERPDEVTAALSAANHPRASAHLPRRRTHVADRLHSQPNGSLTAIRPPDAAAVVVCDRDATNPRPGAMSLPRRRPGQHLQSCGSPEDGWFGIKWPTEDLDHVALLDAPATSLLLRRVLDGLHALTAADGPAQGQRRSLQAGGRVR